MGSQVLIINKRERSHTHTHTHRNRPLADRKPHIYINTVGGWAIESTSNVVTGSKTKGNWEPVHASRAVLLLHRPERRDMGRRLCLLFGFCDPFDQRKAHHSIPRIDPSTQRSIHRIKIGPCPSTHKCVVSRSRALLLKLFAHFKRRLKIKSGGGRRLRISWAHTPPECSCFPRAPPPLR